MQARSLTEYGVQQFILTCIREAGMVTSSAPIAAVNAHSADPHYGPAETGSSEVTRDALLLIHPGQTKGAWFSLCRYHLDRLCRPGPSR